MSPQNRVAPLSYAGPSSHVIAETPLRHAAESRHRRWGRCKSHRLGDQSRHHVFQGDAPRHSIQRTRISGFPWNILAGGGRNKVTTAEAAAIIVYDFFKPSQLSPVDIHTSIPRIGQVSCRSPPFLLERFPRLPRRHYWGSHTMAQHDHVTP
jgi:hypothetical protein